VFENTVSLPDSYLYYMNLKKINLQNVFTYYLEDIFT